jgi:Ras family protein
MDEYSRLSRNASFCDGYALVFSIADRRSFNMVPALNDSLLNTLATTDVPRILIGSMADLEEQRQVSYEEGVQLGKTLGTAYLECSAKTGDNVAEVFHHLLKDISKDDGLLEQASQPGCCVL